MKKIFIIIIFLFIVFQPFVFAEEDENICFGVMSDTEKSYSNMNLVLEFFKDKNLDFVLFPGDMSSVEISKSYVDETLGIMSYWAVGNEEVAVDEIGYLKNTIFPGLSNVVNNFDGVSYSFEYPGLHIIMVNVYHDGDGRIIEGSELYNWIEDDLNSTDKYRQIFVVGHEPAYPKRRHVGDSLDQHPSDRDAFWELLNKYSVEAYINGHTHYYSKDTNHLSVTQIDAGIANYGKWTATCLIFKIVDSGTEVTVYSSGSPGSGFSFHESFIVNNTFGYEKHVVDEEENKLSDDGNTEDLNEEVKENQDENVEDDIDENIGENHTKNDNSTPISSYLIFIAVIVVIIIYLLGKDF